MKWILIVAAVLVVIVAAAAIVGSMLPRTHTASRTLRVKRPAADVWPAIVDAMSSSDVPVDTVERQPPHRLVTRVSEKETMFGGTWTVTIADQPGGGSALTIVEDGWVGNPIFRVMAKYVFGHHATMDGMLKKTAATLNEPAALTGE